MSRAVLFRFTLWQHVMNSCQVHGVGKVIAEEWFKRGIKTIAEAEAAGVMNETQSIGARFHRDLGIRIPRAEVAQIASEVKQALITIMRTPITLRRRLIRLFR